MTMMTGECSVRPEQTQNIIVKHSLETLMRIINLWLSPAAGKGRRGKCVAAELSLLVVVRWLRGSPIVKVWGMQSGPDSGLVLAPAKLHHRHTIVFTTTPPSPSWRIVRALDLSLLSTQTQPWKKDEKWDNLMGNKKGKHLRTSGGSRGTEPPSDV